MATKWEVIDYFDVWGNPINGWEVNNQSIRGELTLSDNATEKNVSLCV